MHPFSLSSHVSDFETSPLLPWKNAPPWDIASNSIEIVRKILTEISVAEFTIENEIAVHKTAIIESGSVLKGPLVIGSGSFIAAGAYLRGGCWIAENCIFGPGSELKSSFVFSSSKLAHFNFVGDSILGSGVNLEAGSIICNYRNERQTKEILVRIGSELHQTGCEKFGALVGDTSRIGANAVLAPGVLLVPGSVVKRAQLCDQEVL